MVKKASKNAQQWGSILLFGRKGLVSVDTIQNKLVTVLLFDKTSLDELVHQVSSNFTSLMILLQLLVKKSPGLSTFKCSTKLGD